MNFGRVLITIGLLVVVGCGVFVFVVLDGSEDEFPWGLQIVIFDVGQADAIVLVEPDGDAVVIDAGHGSTAAGKIAAFLGDEVENGAGDISQVKLGVVTHYDSDHVGGFASFAGLGISFASVVDQGPSKKRKGKATYEGYLKWVGDLDGDGVGDANEPDFVRRTASVGQYWTLGDAQIRVVSARGDTRGTAHDIDLDPSNADIDENPGSVALLVTLGDFEFYTAGDQSSDDWKTGPDTEAAVLAARILGNGESDIDVYKANHHGSDTSNGIVFIEGIDPEVAVISSTLAGANIPKRIAVKVLVENGALVYITGNGLDANGRLTDSTAVTDDDNWTAPPGSVVNQAGDVTILVSDDGARYRVFAAGDWREFSSVDADNVH